MSSFFIATWNCKVTRKQAQTINKRIAVIDATATFVRHYAAGNPTHGWIERPNDGTNSYNWRHADNMRMRQIANEVLGVK